MPSHACIDPNDPYAQAEVLVAFKMIAGVVRLVSAHDATDADILPDLEDIQRRALVSEILDDWRQDRPSGDASPHGEPIMDSHGVGSA